MKRYLRNPSPLTWASMLTAACWLTIAPPTEARAAVPQQESAGGLELPRPEQGQAEQESPAPPPEVAPRGWSAGGRGLFAILAEDSLDETAGLSGVAVYTFATDFDVEIEAALLRPRSQGANLAAGRLTLVPVRGTLRVQLWRFGGAMPYLGGGGGIYFTGFSVDSAVVESLDELGFQVSQEVATALAAHVAGGLEWRRGRWLFGLDAKYVIGNTDADAQVRDQVTGLGSTDTTEIKLDGLWLAAGFRVVF